MPEDVRITAYEVSGRVDYERIIEEFGVKKLESEIITKLKNPSFLFTRGIAFAHRDFDKFVDKLLSGERSAIVCGRGPSENVHLGHLVPFRLVKYFHDTYENVRVYIPISDDEKFYAKKLRLEDAKRYAIENVLDILALGFDPKRTKVILDTRDLGRFYEHVARIAKKITFNTVKGIFGFNESTNVGLIFYPAIQTVHILLPYLMEQIENILVIIGIDQDPYMRLVRDIADELGYPKPASLYVKYIPPLTGLEGKMSASDPKSAIFLSDSEEDVRRKLLAAVTGGAKTIEEQRRHGGKPEQCPVFHYYLFLIDDDRLVEQVYQDCRAGRRFCKQCKLELFEKLVAMLKEHRAKKEEVRKRLEEYLI
jgi:tryptophanyl-tRNA synthetase